MKRLIHALCTVLLVIITATATAQNTASHKKYLFNDNPAVIDFTEAQLSNLFTGKPGQNTSLSLPGSFSLTGPMVSNISKYNRLQTVVIKLTAFNNIFFSLTKRKNDDNSTVYTGHLFSREYADGYELQRTNGNAYQLIKIETEKLLPACSQQ